MSVLPQEIISAWDDRDGAIAFVTVGANGVPNAIYAGAVGMMGDDSIVVANNYFDKTLANIKAGSKGSVLFITKEKKSYQLKGDIEYHDEGPAYDFMKEWNSPKHPGHAAAVLKVQEAYSGATRIV